MEGGAVSSFESDINFMVVVPPLGSVVYFLEYSSEKITKQGAASSYTIETRTGASSKQITLENQVLEVKISGETGLISSVSNKITSQNLVVRSGVPIIPPHSLSLTDC